MTLPAPPASCPWLGIHAVSRKSMIVVIQYDDEERLILTDVILYGIW